ncbi:MAG: hypothetical protein HYX50_02695 [Chloroflexi bacterium]|nr:hypothetical protein [Chloroflexota bacterium]
MLILNKQKAVERMVALAAGDAPATADAATLDDGPFATPRVASFERTAVAGDAAPVVTPRRRRRRTRLAAKPSPA